MDINNLLGTELPIIQGGMANIADGKLAGTISNCGALGIIGSGGMDKDTLRKEIEVAKSITDQPFGVNLMMLSSKLESLVELILEYKVPVVTAGAGSPHEYIEVLQNNGTKVLPVISNPSFGIRMERIGADAIIGEGMEAGGHIGEMTTMTLIPQLASKVNKPVVCAGGIASGKQMLAAEVLGAKGVQIGTAFLLAEECSVSREYKEAIIKANASKVTVIGHKNGMPMRLLKNSMTREYIELEHNGATLDELENFTLGRLKKAAREGDVKTGSVMCGFTAGQLERVKPAKDIIEELMYEYESAKAEIALCVKSI